jgi:hypothetical protein
LDILRAGVFNLGFIALSRCEEALSYLDWWKQRLYDQCVVDLSRGLFLDQRWTDFAPCFISRVLVLRDPAYNVAYWNLHERQVTETEGRFLVNGSPLRFFHFSGFDPNNPDRLSKHQNRFSVDDLPAVKELTQQYSRLLYAYGYDACHQWPYAYQCFENGISIPDVGRPILQERPSLEETVADPFSEEGFRSFVGIWNEPLARPANGGQVITRLAHRLYRTRPNLQAGSPAVFGDSCQGFVRRLAQTAGQEQVLPEVFFVPLRDNACSAGGRPPVAAPFEADLPGITRLAVQIYDRRPDVQSRFPDPAGADALSYLAWLLSYGKRHYGLSEVYLSGLRREWRKQINELPTLWGRLRYRALLRGYVVASLAPLVARMVKLPLRLVQRIARPAPAYSDIHSAHVSPVAVPEPSQGVTALQTHDFQVKNPTDLTQLENQFPPGGGRR